jgi:hypothetical protein
VILFSLDIGLGEGVDLHTSDTTSYAEFNSHARGHDRIFRADCILVPRAIFTRSLVEN